MAQDMILSRNCLGLNLGFFQTIDRTITSAGHTISDQHLYSLHHQSRDYANQPVVGPVALHVVGSADLGDSAVQQFSPSHLLKLA